MLQSITRRSTGPGSQRHVAELLAFALFSLFICAGASAGPTAMQVSNKPVCDRIDNAPTAIAANHPKPALRAKSSATPSGMAVAPRDTDDAASRSRSGGSDVAGGHANPRWQSFLPGMFK